MKSANAKTTTDAFARTVGRALRRAAKTARKIALTHHTPLYIWRKGKVVARKP